MKFSQSSEPTNLTAPSSSARGYAPTSPTLESCGLDQLTSELVQRLTAVESLGLLNDTGKSLLSLLQGKTTSPSTDGSAQKKGTSGTSTSPLRLGEQVWQRGWYPHWQVPTTSAPNPGLYSPRVTCANTTRGWEELRLSWG